MITSSARRTFCLSATALCLLPAAAAAQDRWVGVRAGVNFTTLDSNFVSRDDVFDRATGIVAGAFFNLRLLGLDLQPEALYVVKGAETIDFDITTRLRIDYLEFPVLIRFSRRVSDGVRLYAAAGPAFAVRLRAIARFEFDGGAEEANVDDQIESLDFGITAGGGAEFGRFVIDGRYTHGISNIDSFASGDEKLANRAIALTGGIRF